MTIFYNRTTALATTALATAMLLGSAGCGGAKNAAKDASSADANDGKPKKSLEKFEGNRMEVSEGEEE